MLRRSGLLCLGLTVALLAEGVRSARGDVKLPAIFGDHMVLQRDRKDRVWGSAQALSFGAGVSARKSASWTQ